MKKIEELISSFIDILPDKSTVSCTPAIHLCIFHNHEEKQHNNYQIDIWYFDSHWSCIVCECMHRDTAFKIAFAPLETFTNYLSPNYISNKQLPAHNKDINPKFFKKFPVTKRYRENYLIDGAELINDQVTCVLCSSKINRHESNYIISCSPRKAKRQRYSICKNTIKCDFICALT
jgi:hypothetical protein